MTDNPENYCEQTPERKRVVKHLGKLSKDKLAEMVLAALRKPFN